VRTHSKYLDSPIAYSRALTQLSIPVIKVKVLRLIVPSVHWRCWLGGRKGIQPVKNWVVGCWRGYLSGARCRLAHAQLMPMPLTISCFSTIEIDFAFLVPAHQSSPGKGAIKCVCVCVTSHVTKIGRFGDILPSQTVGLVPKTRNLTWQNQHCKNVPVVPVYLRTPRNRLITILWCVLRLQ